MMNQLIAATAPFNQQSEEATLGGVLCIPDAYYSVSAFLKADDFFLVRHRLIWQAMAALIERQEVLDYLTLLEELKAQKHLDEIGGPAYLTQLVNNTPNSVHTEAYARRVWDSAVRRRVLVAADTIKKMAMDTQVRLEQVSTEALTELETALGDSHTTGVVTMNEATRRVLDHLENALNSDELVALPMGWNDVDELTGGMPRGELTLIAARPGMGKTSLLLGAALNAARMGKRVVFCTMEMGADEIARRAMSIEAGVDSRKLKDPKKYPMTLQESQRVYEAAGRMATWKIFFDGTSGGVLTPSLLRAKCRRLMGRYGLDLIIVDYVGLMDGSGKTRHNREQEVGYIARSLKELARNLNIPVFAAAQLNRDVDKRQNKRPILSDLRDSGELEQASDQVLFLYRDEMYNEATEFPNQAEIIVAKNRNGQLGTAFLYFEKSLTKFQSGTPRHINLNADYVLVKTPRITYINPYSKGSERSHND